MIKWSGGSNEVVQTWPDTLLIDDFAGCHSEHWLSAFSTETTFSAFANANNGYGWMIVGIYQQLGDKFRFKG